MIRKLWVSVAAIAVASLVVACPPTPPQPSPVPPDANDAAPTASCAEPPTAASWQIACNALANADCAPGQHFPDCGCQIGTYPECPDFMARDFGTGKVENKATGAALGCKAIAAVRTKDDARRLGFLCP